LLQSWPLSAPLLRISPNSLNKLAKRHTHSIYCGNICKLCVHLSALYLLCWACELWTTFYMKFWRHTLTQNLKGNEFMGPLTYKVFNLYCFIRCGTYNSHLYTTTLSLKCESIYSACSPFKGKLLLACIVIAGFSANGPAASVVPFVERGSAATVGSLGEPGDRPHRG